MHVHTGARAREHRDVGSACSTVTETVSQTVTTRPAPPAKPVIGSFGFGDLKLGMTGKEAIEAGLPCSSHKIIGTDHHAWVSSKLGVASIPFTPDMASDGVGIGATEEKLKAEYTNLEPAGPNYTYRADADGNPASEFLFGVSDGEITSAMLLLKDQDCHN